MEQVQVGALLQTSKKIIDTEKIMRKLLILCPVKWGSFSLYPFIDESSGDSVEGMICNVNQVLSQVDKQTQIIPGHGRC